MFNSVISFEGVKKIEESYSVTFMFLIYKPIFSCFECVCVIVPLPAAIGKLLEGVQQTKKVNRFI